MMSDYNVQVVKFISQVIYHFGKPPPLVLRHCVFFHPLNPKQSKYVKKVYSVLQHNTTRCGIDQRPCKVCCRMDILQGAVNFIMHVECPCPVRTCTLPYFTHTQNTRVSTTTYNIHVHVCLYKFVTYVFRFLLQSLGVLFP